MAAPRTLCLPTVPSDQSIERSRKCGLKKDVITWLHDNKFGWTAGLVQSAGANFVAALTDCLWYIDGHVDTMASRSCSIPKQFLQFQGYNNPEKSKHRRRDIENMSANVLDTHASVLNSFLLQPWLDSSTWKPMKGAIRDLADAVSKYAAYLQQKNIEIQENHRSLAPVRSASDAESCVLVQGAQWVQPSHIACYRALQNHLDATDVFQPILLNDFAPADTRYEKNMHVYVHFYLHTHLNTFILRVLLTFVHTGNVVLTLTT